MFNNVIKAVEAVVKNTQKTAVDRLKEFKSSEGITKEQKATIQKCIDIIKEPYAYTANVAGSEENK